MLRKAFNLCLRLFVVVIIVGLAHYVVQPVVVGLQPFLVGQLGVPVEIFQVLLAITSSLNSVLETFVFWLSGFLTNPARAQNTIAAAQSASDAAPKLLMPVLTIALIAIIGFTVVQIFKNPEKITTKASRIGQSLFRKEALPVWIGVLLIVGTVSYVLSVESPAEALKNFTFPLVLGGLVVIGTANKKWFQNTFISNLIGLAEGIAIVMVILVSVMALLVSAETLTRAYVQSFTNSKWVLTVTDLAIFLGGLADPVPLAIGLTIIVIVLLTVLKDK